MRRADGRVDLDAAPMSPVRFHASGFVVHHLGRLRGHTLDGDVTFDLAADRVVDAVVVGGELWSMTRSGELERRAAASGQLVATVPIEGTGADAGGRWATSPLARCAAWLGPSPIAVAPTGVVTGGVPDDLGDSALPLTDNRWLVWRGGQLWAWRGIGTAWQARLDDPAARLVEMQVLLEGRLIALCIQPRGGTGRRLLVVSSQDGSLHTSLGLTGSGSVRFAGRRGCAVATVGDRLAVIDLRFGRVLRELDLPETIEEVAVDETMQRAVLLDPRGVATCTPFDDLDAALLRHDDPDPPLRVRASGTRPPLPALPLPEPAPEPEPEIQPSPSFPADPLLSLDPATSPSLATPADIRADLDARLDLVGARAALAIADGWDNGRISAPDPSAPPFAREVVGILRQGRGLAAEHLAAAQRQADAAQLKLVAVDRARAGRQTPRELLAARAGLSPAGVAVLMVAAAPYLRGDYARLYGILGNDPQRPICDELMITHILGAANADAVTRELDADQPLRRHGLISIGDGARPFAAVTVDPVVVRLLAGLPVEAGVDPLLRPRAADRDLEALRMPAPVIAGALRALAVRRDRPVRIAVRGRVGSGRHTLLAALAARAGRQLTTVDATAAPREPARLVDAVRTALRRALALGWIPCVDGLDQVAFDDGDLRHQLAAVLRDHPGPLAVRLPVDATAPLEPGHVVIEVPAQGELERQATWNAALDAHGVALADASELAARYRIGPGVIERVCAEIAHRDEPFADGAEAATALDGGVRQHLETRLGTVATRVHRLATWSDVVLPEDVIDSLLEITARLRYRKTVFETWGFDRSITTSRGITALFQGGPGTGKTMVAGVLARDLGLELYRIDVSRITSKWIGETEKNLASLFDAAEDGQVMLLFDEADSLFAKRTEVRTSVDRYANMEVNYLLQRLDSFEGIAILTTNFGTAIDPAFKRRMSFRVTFPFPDDEMREQLWRALLPPAIPRAGEIDYAELAHRFKLSGGYIRNAALRAAFLAAEEGTPLGHGHVERAIRAEFREVGKLAETGVLE